MLSFSSFEIVDKWTKMATSLVDSEKQIVLEEQLDLVDEVWEESNIDRPPRPANTLITLSNDFAGTKLQRNISDEDHSFCCDDSQFSSSRLSSLP